MNETEFNIVVALITIAKLEQIKTVSKLRDRILLKYPDNVVEINKALTFWANQMKG